MAITLRAQERSITRKKVSQLRSAGFIPAVLFGRESGSRDVAVSEVEFSRMRPSIGATTLIEVAVEGQTPVKALLHHVQVDPRTAKPLHLELFQVGAHDLMKVEVPIHLEGSAPAVVTGGGTLVVTHNSVEVRCDSEHLVSSFHVDISGLATFDDHIRAGDVPMPEGVELLLPADTILVSVTRPRVEEPEEVVVETDTAGPAAAEPAA